MDDRSAGRARLEQYAAGVFPRTRAERHDVTPTVSPCGFGRTFDPPHQNEYPTCEQLLSHTRLNFGIGSGIDTQFMPAPPATQNRACPSTVIARSYISLPIYGGGDTGHGGVCRMVERRVDCYRVESAGGRCLVHLDNTVCLPWASRLNGQRSGLLAPPGAERLLSAHPPLGAAPVAHRRPSAPTTRCCPACVPRCASTPAGMQRTSSA